MHRHIRSRQVTDPTGAGDSFAGGMMGYLASVGDTSEEAIRSAMVYGAVVASFNIEDFSVDRQKRVEFSEISSRYRELQEVCPFLVQTVNRPIVCRFSGFHHHF